MPSDEELERALDRLQELTGEIKGVQGVGIGENEKGLYLAVYVDKIKPHHKRLPRSISPAGGDESDDAIPVEAVAIGKIEPL